MTEFQALQIVCANNGKSIDDMLAAAHRAGHTNYADNHARFLSLLDKGYVEGAFLLGLPVTITITGKDRLEMLQYEAADKAESKRQTRLQNQISIAAILVNLVTFAAGLVVEHFVGIIAFLSDFWG